MAGRVKRGREGNMKWNKELEKNKRRNNPRSVKVNAESFSDGRTKIDTISAMLFSPEGEHLCIHIFPFYQMSTCFAKMNI